VIITAQRREELIVKKRLPTIIMLILAAGLMMGLLPMAAFAQGGSDSAEQATGTDTTESESILINDEVTDNEAGNSAADEVEQAIADEPEMVAVNEAAGFNAEDAVIETAPARNRTVADSLYIIKTYYHLQDFGISLYTDRETGMPVYCLDYNRLSPDKETGVLPLDLEEIFDDAKTCNGVRALLLSGYPN